MQVGVVGHLKSGVVVLQVSGQNVRVSSIQIFQDGAGGGGAVSHVAVTEGTDENFVNGGDKNLPKGLVGLVVLIEDGGVNVMGVAKVDDLGARRNIWDGGLGAGVDRSDEGHGR